MRTAVTALFVLLATAPLARAQDADLAGFSTAFLDPSQNPCQDFYQYACGGWVKSHPIPPDRPAWDRYYQLDDLNQKQVHTLLETAAQDTSATGNRKLIGDYFASCLETQAIEAKGLAPLAPELARIAAVHDRQSLAEEVARLHAFGAEAFFEFTPRVDYKDATAVIAQFDQGGIALSRRESYLDTDAKAVAIQQQYRQHLARIFELLGESPEAARADSDRVWSIEKTLAQASMTRLERRDPNNRYHKMTKAAFTALAPSFDWASYLRTTGAPPFESVNVVSPAFFSGLEKLLTSASLEDERAYLRWQLVDASARFLPARILQAEFQFFHKTLRGQAEDEPRWKQCVRLANRDLGEAVGEVYVRQYFPLERKEQVRTWITAIQAALRSDIQGLSWMSQATRERALEKLGLIAVKIAYPDRSRSYAGLRIERGDALGNAFRAQEFDFRYQLAKIGRPVDRSEWADPPQVFDGYHSNSLNEIVFTAGLLQPPFVDSSQPDAVNLGELGRIIGHELTHAFDDQGRKFDGHGNLTDWWTPEDRRQYEAGAACFVEQYSGFTAVEDVKVNGKLTLGENIADNGGLRLAYVALHSLGERARHARGKFTDDQLLFLAFAQSQCHNVTAKMLRMWAETDPHAPQKVRVNGTVSNMPEFQHAFHCKAGDAMVPAKRCRIW